MTHLKHSGKIRQAAHAKRTAPVEIYSSEPAAPLIAFRVTIKNGSHEVRGFEAMGRDSLAVAEAHECLCEPGQYVSVMPLDKWRAKLAAQFAGSEEFFALADAGREAAKEADCKSGGQAAADRLQQAELARMPGRGFVNG